MTFKVVVQNAGCHSCVGSVMRTALDAGIRPDCIGQHRWIVFVVDYAEIGANEDKGKRKAYILEQFNELSSLKLSFKIISEDVIVQRKG